ncbi:MAG TPA: cell division protein ZapA [Rhodopila sp.]|uniref:cell division protein ZapA n=1 Tax=Rhodopila sp. TaxID=2480087 RepID=UPI002B67C2F7|nr:cell division protein ZapA [Rhodopila sp.]HVY13958.1 cell division protein ZapA [Rhodopila sp.]
MAQVTIRINGYSYTVGCKDGEEKHLEAMAAEVNRRADAIRQTAGGVGETRMLVMLALSMADEIFEIQQNAKPDKRADTERLHRLAKRAEQIAANVEKSD